MSKKFNTFLALSTIKVGIFTTDREDSVCLALILEYLQYCMFCFIMLDRQLSKTLILLIILETNVDQK